MVVLNITMFDKHTQSETIAREYTIVCAVGFSILSSSRTSVPLKVRLFSAKIQNKNDCYTHKLIYQLNEQDCRPTLSFNVDCIFDVGNIIA